MPIMYFPPYSKIFLEEAQRYYDSRQSATFPEFVSRAYEMHRHYGLDIYMDVQRVGLIDKNIRELCRNFIEVQSMQNQVDNMGYITQTVFKCREFKKWTDVNEYLNSGAETTYTETEYVNQGNIFDCFNSYNYFENFVPPDGKDFNYLEYLSPADRQKLHGEIADFYNTSEPKEYRSGKESSTKK
jgi:zona occludens toxin (predicted ATPase)